MIPNIPSRATKRNEALIREERNGRENVEWIMDAVRATGQGAAVVLIGGVDELSSRIRIAQSHLRSDMTPTAWSHAALIGSFSESGEGTTLVEIPLDPLSGHGWAPRMNAVRVDTTLERYDNAEYFPNVAVLRLPKFNATDLEQALRAFSKERGSTDACDLLLRWLAYAWGVGTSANPLFEGFGLPSAALLTRLFGAVGYDLTPGVPDILATPEAIWQSARWWHEHHDEQGQNRITGRYLISDAVSSYQSLRALPTPINTPTLSGRERPDYPKFEYLDY